MCADGLDRSDPGRRLVDTRELILNVDRQVVLERLTGARTRLLASIEGLSETEMSTAPVSGTWTLRELIAHVSGWASWDLEAIRGIQQNKGPDLSVIQDVDLFNELLVTQRAEWSADRILAEMEATQTELLELVGSMSDQHLLDTDAFPGPYWHNLAEWLQVAWEHEEEHASEIQSWREQRGA